MSWFDAGRRRPSSQTSFSSAHPSGGIPLRSRSEEHTSELQSQSNLVCRLLLEKKKNQQELDALLHQHHLAWSDLNDPWVSEFIPRFSLDRNDYVLDVYSPGADKRHDTDDDFSV